jgi:hypothetical protein
MQVELNINQAQPIKLDTVVVTKNRIHISSSDACTTFCDQSRIPTINIDDLVDKYKLVIRLAKKKNIKVSYYRKPMTTKAHIESLRNDYPIQMAAFNAIFDELVAAWEQKAPKGMFSGYGDDDEYNAAVKIAHKLNPLYTHSSVIGQVQDIESSLNNLLFFIERNDGNGNAKIWL